MESAGSIQSIYQYSEYCALEECTRGHGLAVLWLILGHV